MEHDMEEAFFENARVDAVAMERLTFSPYIVSMHGFCGLTVVTEYAPYELSEVALHLNSTERLDMARKVAQGVSDIHHSIQGGDDATQSRPSLVHNDLNLANLRVSQDGSRPVWNDFNIAVLLMKHNETGETCPFASRFPNPQWRSPEEQVYSQDETDLHPPVVTEKIDMYALGNVLYRLVVGASPWKAPGAQKLSAEEKMSVARRKREHGETPPIPPEVLDAAHKDRAVRIMLEAMRQTYRFRPEDRPTAQEVVDLLSSSQP
jgi:serine/threonine protein kinase